MLKSLRVICVPFSFCTVAAAQAESWPSRLIKATIPFGAGSAADVVPRLVFERLAAELGQSIVIENRAGGGGRSARRWSRNPIPTATAFWPSPRR